MARLDHGDRIPREARKADLPFQYGGWNSRARSSGEEHLQTGGVIAQFLRTVVCPKEPARHGLDLPAVIPETRGVRRHHAPTLRHRAPAISHRARPSTAGRSGRADETNPARQGKHDTWPRHHRRLAHPFTIGSRGSFRTLAQPSHRYPEDVQTTVSDPFVHQGDRLRPFRLTDSPIWVRTAPGSQRHGR